MDSVTTFFRWWGSELAALLPPSLRAASSRHSKTLRFDIGRSETIAYYQANGHIEEFGRMARASAAPSLVADHRDAAMHMDQELLAARIKGLKARNTRIIVSPASGLALTKVLELPLAAEENLTQVLSYEMDRQTPFGVDDVYFDYQILSRHPQTKRLTLRLGVVPRKIIDEVLALVQDWNPRPATPGQIRPNQEWDGRTLTFSPQGYGHSVAARINAGLAAANLILLAAVLAVPLYQQQTTLAQLRMDLEKAKLAAEKTTALQHRIDQLSEEMRFLTERKEQWPSVVEVLNELTQLLPDSTWLNRLEIKEGEVHLQGISNAASSLIAPIERSEMFDDVRFRSPVTQDARSNRERFHLSAHIVQQQG